MNVLITGALGYIGGRMALHLHRVYPEANIRLLTTRDKQGLPPWAGDFEVRKGDILDLPALIKTCKDIDTVVHLAALNEIDSQKDPLQALKINGEGTYNLLTACTDNGVKGFIYFSTFHVYGLNAHGEISESTLPAPFHPYAITHHLAEDFIRMDTSSGKIRSVILRVSNGFGYPSHPDVNRWSLVFNNFCLQAVVNHKIVLKTSGKQYRDFITLTDICRCTEFFLKEGMLSAGPIAAIYNLGGDNSLSILQAARMVAEEHGKITGIYPEVIVNTSSNEKEPDKPLVYKIERLKKLGFSLTSNVREEIRETINVCLKNRRDLECRL